ncbi:hypothetical protein Lal_00045531 [Lupinus albus]|uniref:Putative QWRF family protein n=1 Tax=Lupinus albus TaxID=3870 RepID=A0A6A5NSV2_LUPAL|nr:putative QWRF family protein [Lupinus albus]KAF1886300.1 hypothetical protein Lal_00045531 [Lupinus albus]
MVAAISTPLNSKRTQTPTRPPLLPSESDNALAPPRRSKSREVTSRYMSSSSSSSSSLSSFSVSKRCVSPQITRTMNSTPSMIRHTTPLLKRSQSVGRKRLGTPRFNSNNNDNNNSLCASAGNGNVLCGGGATQKVLFTSTRSLSVSFQGESFSIQVSKAKPAPSPSVSSLRKCTPERKKTSTTPCRNGGSDQQPWPGKIPAGNCMNRNSDCGGDSARKIVRSLQNSIADVRASIERNKDGGSEVNASDNESLSSSSSSEFGGGSCGGRSHASVVPARFWKETNTRSRRQTENPSSPSSKNGGKGNKPAIVIPPKLFGPKKLQLDCPVLSPRGIVNSRGLIACSPIGSTIRPPSPSKLPTPWSPSRGISPSQSKSGVASSLSNRFGNEPSVLSFAVDVSRGKIWESRITDAHLLRLAYNRLLQWRFVNARADAALSVQTLNAEKSLYDAWLATSKLRESVRTKRTELQMLKQQFKLISILKEQMIHLEDWACLDLVYSSSLSGAIEGLKASTLRLPIVGGAKADVLNVKDAICSAMDVMQAMASSICLLLPKVGHINSLVTEVTNLNAKERALLKDCRDLLSIVIAMQVKECSLRTHISQVKCLSQNPTMKTSK